MEHGDTLERLLSVRQLCMVAIGGTIGTGLFLSSGSCIAIAGPLGALIAFSLIGILVFLIMASLGEMISFLPIAGSFNALGGRLVEPALSFSLGWNCI